MKNFKTEINVKGWWYRQELKVNVRNVVTRTHELTRSAATAAQAYSYELTSYDISDIYL